MILVGLHAGTSFSIRRVMVLRTRPSAARRIVGLEKAISDGNKVTISVFAEEK